MSSDVSFNLSGARIILIAGMRDSLDILGSIIAGFRVGEIVKCTDVDDAKRQLTANSWHAAFVDFHLDKEDGHELVKWIRRHSLDENRTMPILFLSANYTKKAVREVSNSGANFAISKPYSPETLLPRLVWLAEYDRDFIEAPNYVGPDRRVRFEGLEGGMVGRRASDLSAEVGEASQPNMSQDAIDALMMPQKVSFE